MDFRTLGAFYEDYPLIATFPQQTGQSLDHVPDKVLGGPWESSVPIAGGGSPGAPVTGVCSGLPFRTLRKPAARHDRGGGFSPGAWEMAVDKARFPARILSASPLRVKSTKLLRSALGRVPADLVLTGTFRTLGAF